MGISKEAYKALEAIVGAEYISDDPVITETYMRGGPGVDTPLEWLAKRPGCVLLPKTTEEVQQIVKLCNRYKLPFVPASTFWLQECAAKITDVVFMDLKRMNKFEIDDKNLYAVVESGVIFSQLQEEAMQRGVYTLCPGGGAQVSVLANHIMFCVSPLCYRVSYPSRRILGVEWVLPDGELVRLGSLAIQKDPFWGEGLGPDLRGILRGFAGWLGHAGVVTRIAVKLFPLFQPERLEPIGISPHTALQLPVNRMRWYNITMPTEEALLKAMHEIGRAEIAAAITRVPVLWRYRARAKSREDFWEVWEKDAETIRNNPSYIIRVLLIGYTSEKQLEYEDEVLKDIIAEHGGEFRRTRPTDESWIKSADAVGMWWSTGAYHSIDWVWDTLSHSTARGKAIAQIKEKEFMPPLMDEYGEKGWVQIVEFGHGGYLEFLVQWDPSDPDGGLKYCELWVAAQRAAIDEHHYTTMLAPLGVSQLTGAAFGPNYYFYQEKIRQALDPNNLSNPPHDTYDKIVEQYAPQFKEKYKF